MNLLRYLDPRRSFAAKLVAGLLAVAGVLLAVTLPLVESETRGQVELVTERTIERARRAFEESERLRRQQLAQRASQFTDSRRGLALVEAAIEAGDTAYLADQVGYTLQLTQLDSTSLTVITNSVGNPVISFVGQRPVEGDDPAGVRPLAEDLLDSYEPELFTYRTVDDRLYTVRVLMLDLVGRVIGTIAFGLPIQNQDADLLGDLVGAEICFVVEGRCVAGTPLARTELADRMVEVAGHDRVMATRGGERWELVSQPIAAGDGAGGHMVMAVPLEEVLAPFDRIRRALTGSSLAALALALVISILLSRGLSRPIRELVAATGRVGRGEYDARVADRGRDELGQLARSFNEMTEGLALKEQYRGVLDKVVSRDVAEELLRGEIRLGGENREISILFADIRGFTALSEGMEPQAVIALLNETMERLGAAVEDAGGVVDKYVGDEIMAVFGAPIAQPDHAVRAARAAVAMQESMEHVNRDRVGRGEPPIGIGVGVHTGEAVAGNMGSASRLNYTVVGDAVNLASRLCSAARPGEILISDATRYRLPPDLRTTPVGERDLKGFSRPIRLFQLHAGAGGAGLAAAGRATG